MAWREALVCVALASATSGASEAQPLRLLGAGTCRALGDPMSSEIEVRELARQPAAVIRFRSTPGRIAEQLGPAFGEIGAYLHEAGIEHEAAGVYARFLAEGPEVDVEAGFTVAAAIAAKGRVEPGGLPECEAAVALHVGPYGGLPAARKAIRDWMAANDREPEGAPWELYLSDPQTEPPAEWKTEVYWPLKPR